MNLQNLAPVIFLFIVGEFLAYGVFLATNETRGPRNRAQEMEFINLMDRFFRSPVVAEARKDIRFNALQNSDLLRTEPRQHHHSSHKPPPPIPLRVACPNLECPAVPACPPCPPNQHHCPACPKQHLRNSQTISCSKMFCPDPPSCPACPPCPNPPPPAIAPPHYHHGKHDKHHEEKCPKPDRCDKFKLECSKNFGVYCEASKKCIIFLPKKETLFPIALARCAALKFTDKSVSMSLLNLGNILTYDQTGEFYSCTKDIFFTSCYARYCWTATSKNACNAVHVPAAETTGDTDGSTIIVATTPDADVPTSVITIDTDTHAFDLTAAPDDGDCTGFATPICEASTKYCHH